MVRDNTGNSKAAPSTAAPAMTLDGLQCGDVMLYRPDGLFGSLIALKTWHRVSHVEVYVGLGQSMASRDGKGVGLYDVRLRGLTCVLRPSVFDATAAWTYFRQVEGQPYGWLDLAAFAGLGWNGPGMICSTFAACLLRAAGVHVFRDEPAEKIAPFQFELSELLLRVWPPVF